MFRHLLRRPGSTALGCAAAASAAVVGLGTAHATADAEHQRLCIDKLACHRNVPPPRTPVVLVSCGSFNPPTIAHLRMFDLATHALAERGHDVWGCYMSPVADAYGKQGLAHGIHRLKMCSLAAAGTDNVMLDTWEATRPGYTRTLEVLQHIASSLAAYMEPQPADTNHIEGPSGAGSSINNDTINARGLAAAAAAAAVASSSSAASQPAAAHPGSDASHSTSTHPSSSSSSSVSSLREASSSRTTGPSAMRPTGTAAAAAASKRTPATAETGTAANDAQASAVLQPRVMLLCGADLLGTINQPGVWKDPDIILQEHGIVCVCRAGTDVQDLLQQKGTLLHEHRDRVIVVHEPVENSISSSWVRKLLGEGQPVRYLVPDAVLEYIQQQGLYTAGSKAAGVQHA